MNPRLDVLPFCSSARLYVLDIAFLIGSSERALNKTMDAYLERHYVHCVRDANRSKKRKFCEHIKIFYEVKL